MPRLDARRRLILSMIPTDRLVVDVGADHGYLAGALPRAIATERRPHLARAHGLRWVVADGLAPFRRVEVAVIAGMGAHTIAGILSRGPRPEVAVVHAPDDPVTLRILVARDGWRIDAEGLAPEAKRYAEVLRIVPGHEPATGLRLEHGPRLLEGDDPHLRPHLDREQRRYAHLAQASASDAARSADFARRAAFLASELARRGWAQA